MNLLCIKKNKKNPLCQAQKKSIWAIGYSFTIIVTNFEQLLCVGTRLGTLHILPLSFTIAGKYTMFEFPLCTGKETGA